MLCIRTMYMNFYIKNCVRVFEYIFHVVYESVLKNNNEPILEFRQNG